MMERVDRIMAVMERAFDPFYGEGWNRRQVSDALVMPNTFAHTIDRSGLVDGTDQAAGFTLSRAAADEEELLLIAVLPGHRGQGFGARLLRAQIAAAQERGVEKVFLEMRADNPAETFYRAFDFQPIGRRRDYYRVADGTKRDALTFVKHINTPR